MQPPRKEFTRLLRECNSDSLHEVTTISSALRMKEPSTIIIIAWSDDVYIIIVKT